MGVAAYNRGSALISRQIDRDQRPREFEFMDEFNAVPKRAGAGTPFGPVVIKTDQSGNWWILDPEKLFGGFGFVYPTMREIMARWRIVVTGYDSATDTWHAEPMPR